MSYIKWLIYFFEKRKPVKWPTESALAPPNLPFLPHKNTKSFSFAGYLSYLFMYEPALPKEPPFLWALESTAYLLSRRGKFCFEMSWQSWPKFSSLTFLTFLGLKPCFDQAGVTFRRFSVVPACPGCRQDRLSPRRRTHRCGFITN